MSARTFSIAPMHPGSFFIARLINLRFEFCKHFIVIIAGLYRDSICNSFLFLLIAFLKIKSNFWCNFNFCNYANISRPANQLKFKKNWTCNLNQKKGIFLSFSIKGSTSSPANITSTNFFLKNKCINESKIGNPLIIEIFYIS